MTLWSSALLVLITAAVVTILQNYLQQVPPERDVEGFVADGWEQVANVFRANMKRGLEKGAAFSAYYRGEKVVDLYGGYANLEAEQPLDRNSLGLFYSATKGVAALMIAHVVDSGLASYNDTVSKYWPEFAKNGKENVTIRQLVSHQAGVAGTDEPITVKLLQDKEKLAKVLAAQEPFWVPGSTFGYHAFTYGLYLDQLVRHIDPKHRSLPQYFKEEVAEPFDLDFHIGLPRSEHYRAVRLHPASTLDQAKSFLDPNTLKFMYKVMFDPNSYLSRIMSSTKVHVKLQDANNPYVREIDSASVMGWGTAESLAKLYGTLSIVDCDRCKLRENRKLLSSEMVQKLHDIVIYGAEVVTYTYLNMTLGLVLHKNIWNEAIVGHPGAGGQAAFADIHHHLGYAYVTNFHGVKHNADDPRFLTLQKAVYDCVGRIENQS